MTQMPPLLFCFPCFFLTIEEIPGELILLGVFMAQTYISCGVVCSFYFLLI